MAHYVLDVMSINYRNNYSDNYRNLHAITQKKSMRLDIRNRISYLQK